MLTEIMNRSMSDHHWKPGSTRWLCHPSVGLFSSGHPECWSNIDRLAISIKNQHCSQPYTQNFESMEFLSGEHTFR